MRQMRIACGNSGEVELQSGFLFRKLCVFQVRQTCHLHHLKICWKTTRQTGRGTFWLQCALKVLDSSVFIQMLLCDMQQPLSSHFKMTKTDPLWQ